MYTTIIHEWRKALGISVYEYMIADLYDRLSNKPEHPFCTLAQMLIGDELGISRKHVIDCLKKLVSSGFIEKSPKRNGGFRTTPKWYGAREEWYRNNVTKGDFTPEPEKVEVTKGDTRSNQRLHHEVTKGDTTYINTIINNNTSLTNVREEATPENVIEVEDKIFRSEIQTSPVTEVLAKTDFPGAPPAQPASYGNKDVNDVLAYLKSVIGITGFAEPISEQRKWAMNIGRLGREIGTEEFKHRLQCLIDDKYKRKKMNKTINIYYEIKGFIPEKHETIPSF